jgi:hypothetical protein
VHGDSGPTSNQSITEGYANNIKDVTDFSVAFNEIIRDSPGFEQEAAQTLRHETLAIWLARVVSIASGVA